MYIECINHARLATIVEQKLLILKPTNISYFNTGLIFVSMAVKTGHDSNMSNGFLHKYISLLNHRSVTVGIYMFVFE